VIGRKISDPEISTTRKSKTWGTKEPVNQRPGKPTTRLKPMTQVDRPYRLSFANGGRGLFERARPFKMKG
jgi:hypothetical protein